MFRKLMDVILRRVNRLIAEWIEPISSEQIDLSSILTGKIDMRHIQVRQKVTDFFPLPVNLIFK